MQRYFKPLQGPVESLSQDQIDAGYMALLSPGCVEITIEEAVQLAKAAETPEGPPSQVSPAQIRIALNQMGLRAQVEAAVEAGSQDLKDWWEYSTEIQRNHPLVVQMAAGLGVSVEQTDALFMLASTL